VRPGPREGKENSDIANRLGSGREGTSMLGAPFGVFAALGCVKSIMARITNPFNF